MEAAVVSALMTNIVARLFAVLEKRCDQLCALHDDINFMIEELEMIGAEMEDQLVQRGHPRAVQRTSMAVMRKLALDIEDCLDQFLPCAACEEDPASVGDPVKFVDEIQKLKKRLEAAHQQKTNYGVGSSRQASEGLQGQPAASDYADTFEDHHHYVGIEKPKQELLDLLEGEREKLMVISIVGFGGSGKTALAKAVYHSPQIHGKYLRRAWAVASKHKDDAKGLLTAILQQLLPSKAPAVLPTQQVAQLQQHIRHHLRARSTRCLIVIDDIEEQHWSTIEPIISVETSSRILVTTTIHSVANKCSSGDGYIYNMRTLSVEDSKVLLKKKVSSLGGSSPALEDGSAAIVHRCDGHPLALVSVANHLLGERELTGQFCKDTSRLLCSHMDKDKHGDFTRLRQVLENNYCSLPGCLKTCLLYTSLFPTNRPISRKTLTRRWLAEGYIDGDLEAADENFKELINRNLMQSVDESNNGKVKTCKPQGIMHQFMLYKSMSYNFITSFGAENRRSFRHLVIENHISDTTSSMDQATCPASHSRNRLYDLFTFKGKVANINTSTNTEPVSKQLRPRSLTVFGSAGEAVSDLKTFELLRVLDLKECSGLSEVHLGYIYKLLHLKYLTLGSSVSNLSIKMERLHCLETLDLRKTKIEILPVEVISLPHLAHLFGKIKLKRVSAKNRKNFNLQTLAGVVVDSKSGFPQLMVYMKKLTKVKIWCEISSTDSNYTLLSNAIREFAHTGTGTAVGTRSLSLHLNDSNQDLLPHHQGGNTDATPIKRRFLSSLKLHGRPSQFEFVKSLCGLAELSLTSVNLTGDDLSKLTILKFLVCLKLVEVHLAGLRVNLEDFPSLKRLCLVVEKPIFLTIQQGALPGLTSIQLLCKDLVGLCDHIQVRSFQCLQEIALDSMVTTETIELWENEARIHPKRPRVLLLNRVVLDGKYVAIDQGSSEPPVLCGCAEICCHADQGSPEGPTQGTP